MDRTIDRTVFKAIQKALMDLSTRYLDKEMHIEASEVYALREYLSFRFVNNQIWIDDKNPDNLKAYIKPLGKAE